MAIVWLLAFAPPVLPPPAPGTPVTAQIIEWTARDKGAVVTVNAGTKKGVAVGWVVEWAAWKGTEPLTLEKVTPDDSRFRVPQGFDADLMKKENRRVRLRPP